MHSNRITSTKADITDITPSTRHTIHTYRCAHIRVERVQQLVAYSMTAAVVLPICMREVTEIKNGGDTARPRGAGFQSIGQ